MARSSTEFTRQTSQRIRYPGHTCATCDGPLDLSEQHLNILNANIHCSQNKSAGHLPLKCFSQHKCGRKFATISELLSHYSWHGTLSCTFPGCNEILSSGGFSRHYFKKHPKNFQCAQCGQAFDFQTELDSHGTGKMHAAYVCGFPDCGSQSARMTELIRHQKVHQSVVTRYPCTYCRK